MGCEGAERGQILDIFCRQSQKDFLMERIQDMGEKKKKEREGQE